MLTPPGNMFSNLKYDEPLSNFAFKFNLRRYIKSIAKLAKVGRCRLTPG